MLGASLAVSDVIKLEEVFHDQNAEYLNKLAYSYRRRYGAGGRASAALASKPTGGSRVVIAA
ncbi:hypothetical protein GFL82_05345 [Rhizobium laguerreae]|nr:hypothetical protein [Rhizobium laguerreae]